MTTREWLEMRKRFPGLIPPPKDPKMIDRLIAHLDVVGWPEEPKECNSCRSRDDKLDWCEEHQQDCDDFGRTCGAWTRREP